ncbi:MAG: hypothetical protein OTI34_06845, partial [Lewinella sp.]|nr:hypothetical protein [Lewinella sp.]
APFKELFVRDVSRLRAAKLRRPTPPLQVLSHFTLIFFQLRSHITLWGFSPKFSGGQTSTSPNAIGPES